MTDRIAQTLTKLFEKHRIVFWYDSKQELRQEFESIALDNIEKIELNQNEFGIKYRILRQQPKTKFLIYQEGSQPADLDNWLLDTQLAYSEFRTDQVSMWLADLELGMEFTDVVQDHIAFFQSLERKEALHRLLKSDDTPSMIRFKMLAVCAGCGSEARLDAVLEQLLGELSVVHGQYSEGQDGNKYKLIKRCELDRYFWEQMKRNYAYSPAEPSIKDFVLQLFSDCYTKNFTSSKKPKTENLSPDALVFLKRWRDSIKCKESFEILSNQCAEDLDIERDLEKQDIRELIEIDYFRSIDQKILSSLVRSVEQKTVSNRDISQWIWQRKQSHWYPEFQHLYEAIAAAAQFIAELDGAHLIMDSLADGIQKYSSSWFRLDQLYRKFVYNVRCSGESSLMEQLVDLIENLYVNNYLLKVNDRWQLLIDATQSWSAIPIRLQKEFFSHWVQPFLKSDKKIFVIISDAMRYEIGDELVRLIAKEDRYEASIEPAMSMLPSYTQLGMAALLPIGTTLTLADDTSGNVKVGDHRSDGLENRKKQLDRATHSKRTTALKAEELMQLNRGDSRSLVRDHDVVYIYHDHIDETGDKQKSEPRVFEAVEKTLEELIEMIKKLTAANANNILVTSDHGFIYQNRPIDESDFVSAEPQGKEILYRDRRFVLGKGLQENCSLRKFTSKELGLAGDMEVQIPKSINRLRLKGSGSRFVHGGASLQEIVIPVIKINKKRSSDITVVEVEILRGASSIITAAQLTVMIYQTQAVSDKVQPRILRAGIYTQADELISDSHDLIFDLSSDDSRDREISITFVLTRQADEVNSQEVNLRLDEKLLGTSQYKKYKSISYTMRRSFTSDFDF
jgi:uncharacterized protein (TIGR02687 family)